MAREIIARIAQELEDTATCSDIEDICVEVIKDTMELEDRILDDAEIEDIVEEVVEEEAIPYIDPEPNEVVEVTDVEWDNVPEDMKITDTDGDESIVVNGSVHKVKISKDMRVEHISSKIIGELKGIFNIVCAENGLNLSYNAYKKTADELNEPCPECDSWNVTPVWYDDDAMVCYCSDCGAEYEVELNYTAPVEQQTAEDVDLIQTDDTSIFGSIFFDSEQDMWCWQIWENGELIYEDYEEDPEEIETLFESIIHSYDEIEENAEVIDIETGEEDTVTEVTDGEVVMEKSSARRIAIAVKLASGKKVLNKSNVYQDVVCVGQVYRNRVGEELEVVDTENDVMFVDNKYDEAMQDFRASYNKLSNQQFLARVADEGYQLLM